jgi:hypothetical protein
LLLTAPPSGPLPLARGGLGWGPLQRSPPLPLLLTTPPSGPLPLARGGLGWGPLQRSPPLPLLLTASPSGPLPLARGGLGWGSSWAIASFPQLHKKPDRPLTQFPPLLHHPR